MGFAVPWLQTGESGARVPHLEGEQVVVPAKGTSDSCE